MQTRTHSFLETCANTAVGYLIAVGSQIVIFPVFGIHIPLGDNFKIGVWFTAVSLVRGYLLRRWFTHRTEAVQ